MRSMTQNKVARRNARMPSDGSQFEKRSKISAAKPLKTEKMIKNVTEHIKETKKR